MECVEKEKFAFDKLESTPVNPEAVDKYDKDVSLYATRKLLKGK